MASQAMVSSMLTPAMMSLQGGGGESMNMGVQPNKWIPLNPGLMNSYYDIFYHSWIVRTCFQEKIKAGLSGGFGYTWGKTRNTNSRGTKGKGKGKKKGSPGQFDHTGDGEIITDSLDMPWIEEVLEKAAMYHDITGIVAFRTKIHPVTGTPRLEVIDLKKGYFIGKVDDAGNSVYGWVFHQNIASLSPGTSRPTPGSNGTLSGNFTISPAPGTLVYAWPTLEPDIGASAPFKSIMATIYVNLLSLREMWQNELEGHFKNTHPAWITESEFRTRAPDDMNDFDMLLDVSGQLGPAESHDYFARSRMNAEVSIHMNKSIEAMHEKNDSNRQRRIGIAPDYTETSVIRKHSWQDNHYIGPLGTKVVKGPEAKLRGDIVAISHMVAAQIAATYGVPIPFFSGSSGKGGGSKTTVGSRLEGSSFRGTLVMMRKRISRCFEEVFMMLIGKQENMLISSKLGQIGNGDENDEEVMVRHYVQTVLQAEGSGSIIDFAKTVRADRTAQENIVSVMDPALEKELKGVPLEMENIRKRIASRKIFITPQDPREPGRVDIKERENKSHLGESAAAPNTQGREEDSSPFIISRSKKALMHGKTRGRTQTERSRDDVGKRQPEYRPVSTQDALVASAQQSTDPAVILENLHEMEIQDMLSEQSWLSRIEEAQYQKMVTQTNQEDHRVSRIMMMAMEKFRITLNAGTLRAALRSAVQENPKLDNMHHVKIQNLEDTTVSEIMKQRKTYLAGLLKDTRRIRIVWNSAPIPDFEMLAEAAKNNLGIPPEMVGYIISKEMGVEDVREMFAGEQEMSDRAIESYLARSNMRVTSKTTGMEKKEQGKDGKKDKKKESDKDGKRKREDSKAREGGKESAKKKTNTGTEKDGK